MEMEMVDVEIPEGTNVILGQSHFIKTVEDLYETLAESGMSIKFGLAFCEASMKRLVRSDGNEPELVKHAEKEAMKIGAGHSFIIFMKEGFPVNIVNRIQGVSRIGGTISIQSIVSIAMIGYDHHIIVLVTCCFNHFTHTLIHCDYCLFNGIINTRMSNHIAIGKVQADEVGCVHIDVFDNGIFYSEGTHLRLQVIGGNLG